MSTHRASFYIQKAKELRSLYAYIYIFWATFFKDILFKLIRYYVFLLNTKNLYTVVWVIEFLSDTNYVSSIFLKFNDSH